jgi:hypothetical protein
MVTISGKRLVCTADDGRQFEVDIVSSPKETHPDPSGSEWIARVYGYHVFPDYGFYWASQEDALDAAEAWMQERSW